MVIGLRQLGTLLRYWRGVTTQRWLELGMAGNRRDSMNPANAGGNQPVTVNYERRGAICRRSKIWVDWPHLLKSRGI